MPEFTGHIPVLYQQSLDAMQLKNGSVVIDGTLGGAGHAKGILERITPGGILIGVDKDEDAISRGELRLKEYAKNIVLVHSDFKETSDIKHLLGEQLGEPLVDAVLLDLGVSSFQLDQAERGFSYQDDTKLDMRMDRSVDLTAAQVVNNYSQQALTKVINDYGEERWAARIAEFIVKAREEKKIDTTGQLVRVIKQAIPKGARSDGPHPAKRTFQAIRIEVNGELAGLREAIENYARLLKKGGRLAIITFHSLEDRIVKQEMKRLNNPCECPRDFPVCVCGKKPLLKVITRKPILPDAEEIENNSRARSAKLRVAERI